MKCFYINIFLAAVAAMALSCRMEEPQFVEPVQQEISPVTVSLKLSISAADNGTPQTKAIDDPASVDDTQIKNMCVIQFNGTGMDATQVGDVHYLKADVDPEDEDYLDFGKIKLADSWGATHTLVFLTNTFAQLSGTPGETTLGEMLDLWHNTSAGEPAVFGHEIGKGDGFPDDATYYQRMNALAVTVVDNGTIVHGVLRRSMARINVQIDNTGRDNLKIVSAQLRNVSQKDYYVTDYSYITSFTSWADYTTDVLISDAFQDEYNPKVPLRADYAAKTWAQGGGTNDGSVIPGEGTGTASYRWYAPSNMRGTDASNSYKETKNLCPNAFAATYLYIVATYGASDETILYRFYLGDNQVNNFDLKPNTSYNYRFTFDGKGNATTDSRVEDLGARKFEYDANCYILNPSPLGDRVFSFNVIHRPNIFWGSPNEGARYAEVNDAFPNNYISTTEHWFARVLWSDYPYTTEQINAMLINKTGTGAGNYDDDISRVKVKIPSDIVRGNIVIGVWANSDGDPETNKDIILWSWHLWITDYQPDRITGHAPVAGTYVYNVEGGQVHRYNNDMWNTGALKNGYIMDRYLGALDRNAHGYARGGGLYYQQGRKDPLSGNYTGYRYDYDGTRSNVGYNDGATAYGATGQGGKNVPWSVMNPRRYITSNANYWSVGDIFSKTSNTWNDPNIGERTATEEGGRSIFDPCPPGWKVPAVDCMASFATSNCVWNGHNLGKGITYYPDGGYEVNKNKDVTEAQAIFFPANPYRDNNGTIGTTWDDYVTCIVWYSNPSSTTHGICCSINKSNPRGWWNPGRTAAGNVRCVRE